MVIKPIYGSEIVLDLLNDLDDYILFTMKEPWEIISGKVSKNPSKINFNFDMNLGNLENIFDQFKTEDSLSIVGLGGGASCDSAKFISWKFKEALKKETKLYLIPSIISVDAFLCSSIAVRIDGKVNYIGDSHPDKIIIDYNLIQRAPKHLNRAGISDTISIASALGDWKIARDEINESFNEEIFRRAKKIAFNLIKSKNEIRKVSKKGINSLVEGFYSEVELCEEWGNSRPEEGSEHFLAYCLESLTNQHYIHGNLIGLCIIISLYLQEDRAEFELNEIIDFLNEIKLNWSLANQNIDSKDLINALKAIKSYVKSEKLFYSIYNSPTINLDSKRIEKIIKMVKKRKNN